MPDDDHEVLINLVRKRLIEAMADDANPSPAMIQAALRFLKDGEDDLPIPGSQIPQDLPFG